MIMIKVMRITMISYQNNDHDNYQKINVDEYDNNCVEVSMIIIMLMIIIKIMITSSASNQ